MSSLPGTDRKKPEMFHAKDGFYFERLLDGSVRVLCRRKQPGTWVSGAPVDEKIGRAHV